MTNSKLSVFRPAEPSTFEVVDGKSPKKRVQKKKRWNQAIKLNAVKKFYELGLTKTVRTLIEEFPEQYQDLTPSTLQYWVQMLSPKLITN
ncbi:hypothetical protein KM1_238970 [Entamoeba histolytica HM-3:IMSS]|uniref:Uncharacterized protein n=4 Tax=Entamoeba TaxID=5758 RepID=A0A175JRD3_ENTHI|nr:hypothetical protein ENU1_148450 [Entamoeba nuttalli P19]EKE38897.1 hypothetical protein ENU1_148450 [Entamoeba nuttalli P19]EMD44655.1 Hypothetical protein EHI5A_192530 [Entamoeba histolytica KU27]EMS11378.1 hypothetical protein KM1_238970 [Entamoeba histolytica HM-3:IMSS]GAT95954.1 hypothetical protein CL6EHI_c00118 [Entamoeba histolytica]|eukprot:XP_008858767.1 hypothetical protein ENU1_148450 [Entamoeba nuttalli P19]